MLTLRGKALLYRKKQTLHVVGRAASCRSGLVCWVKPYASKLEFRRLNVLLNGLYVIKNLGCRWSTQSTAQPNSQRFLSWALSLFMLGVQFHVPEFCMV